MLKELMAWRLNPAAETVFETGPKATSLEKQPAEVKALMRELGRKYVFLGGWLNDHEFDELVELDIDGRVDIMIGKNDPAHVINVAWLLLSPNGEWTFVAKNGKELVEKHKDCRIDVVRAIWGKIKNK